MSLEIKHIESPHEAFFKPINIHTDLPALPFTLACIGQSRSGKSNFIKNLLMRSDMYASIFKPEYLFIFSQSLDLNDDFDQVNGSKFNNYDENIIDEIFEAQKANIDTYGKARTPHVLIVLDDIFDNPKFHRSKLMATLCMRGRHAKISIIFSGQKFSCMPRGCRLNLTHMCLFRCTENEFDYVLDNTIAKKDRKKTMEKMQDIFIKPYTFVTFDFLTHEPLKRLRVGLSIPFEI